MVVEVFGPGAGLGWSRAPEMRWPWMPVPKRSRVGSAIWVWAISWKKRMIRMSRWRTGSAVSSATVLLMAALRSLSRRGIRMVQVLSRKCRWISPVMVGAA
jgi:hypothetical protein